MLYIKDYKSTYSYKYRDMIKKYIYVSIKFNVNLVKVPSYF